MAETRDTSHDDGERFAEFVILMALLTSLVALSIDAMLPALPRIGDDLGVANPNENQLVITTLFLGMAAGQMLYGPLSDSIGRKPAIYLGLGLFMVGCVISMVATSFTTMLAARVLQGVGVAGPRIVTIALIRDRFEGRGMARVMSFVMAVFIMVPAVAPAIGQGVLMVASWRYIFGTFLVLAIVCFAWLALRQPETHTKDKRKPFSVAALVEAIRITCTNRISLGYTIAAGPIFGAFIGYLNSSQQILQVQYGLGTMFPLYFALLALAIGGASFVNARLVVRFGMRLLSWRALIVLCLVSVGYFGWSYAAGGHPPLWSFMVFCCIVFFCIGLLFANFNALAMEPMGEIAGVAAAVIGSLTTFISLILGALVGQAYDGTVLPLVSGFAGLGVMSLLIMWFIERGRAD